MSESTPEHRIAIIGAGAAGTMTAIRLLQHGSRVPVRILLVDPAPAVGRGVAYGTGDRRHRLNVPAGRMSADPNQPLDFVAWLALSPGRSAGPDDYVPRAAFGSYLADCLARAEQPGGAAALTRVHARVTELCGDQAGARLRLDSGMAVDVDAAVLALGVFAPGCGWAPEVLRRAAEFVADPWAPAALAAVPEAPDVLLVGTGLTMIDVALSLDRPHRVLHAVSRHGLLPQVHARTPATPISAPDLAGPTNLRSVRAAVVRQVATAQRRTGDWRCAVDGLRPFVATWWISLPAADRIRFLQEDRRIWDTHRHRMPTDTAADIATMRAHRRLVVHTGEITEIFRSGSGLCARLSSGISLRVGAVVNCTGAQEDLRKTGDPLITNLLATGQARPGPLGLGLDTTGHGHVLPRTGRPGRLWTLGSIRKGNLWETTAFAEIREQADQVATDVLAAMDRVGNTCDN
jgi:uncharacterized NAD(P)/FAD-binding protein YdhS